MFIQNFIELSAAVNELSWVQEKNSDEHITVRRYRADSDKVIDCVGLQVCRRQQDQTSWK